jgi:hypothetical protein
VKKLSLDDSEDTENTDPNRVALINRDKIIADLEFKLKHISLQLSK